MKSCGKPSNDRYESGCRCYSCCKAHQEYERAWAKQDRSMVGEQQVKKAQKKLRSWLDQGFSIREICRATGITRNSIRILLTGKHPSAPIDVKTGKYVMPKRMSRANYNRIMACEKPNAPTRKSRVDASSLNSAIKWLDEHGVKRATIVKMSGLPERTVYSLGDRKTCEYGTLSRIANVAVELKEMAS